MRSAAVVGQQGGQPVEGHHLHRSTSPATAQGARPTSVTAQLADDLLRSAAVVRQQGGQAGAGQHPHTATSPASASNARPGGITGQLGDETFRPEQQASGVLPSGVADAGISVIVSATAPAPHKAEHPENSADAQQPARSRGRACHGGDCRAGQRKGGDGYVGRGGRGCRGGTDILASVVMPDPEIDVLREKLKLAAPAPNVEAQQGAPPASSAPAEDPTATSAKSLPATTGEVGGGKQKRKGKAKAGSSKGSAKMATQGRKGSGVRVDKETGLAMPEMKFGKKSRYICRSMDKTEAAYCIAVAVSAFDGYVSDVILGEFGGVKEDVMKQYRSD
ncbi:unnamed protein product [Closterium sp. Yama58-4]|nr:unnamed protein product [Closterium sp. Yama58-4]